MNLKSFKKKLLRINLTKKNFNIENISNKDLIDYLGGRGLGAKILFEEVKGRLNQLCSGMIQKRRICLVELKG